MIVQQNNFAGGYRSKEVATSKNKLVEKYLENKLIWFIHEPFNRKYAFSDPMFYGFADYDWSVIADIAVNATNKPDVIVCHGINARGFTNWDLDTQYNNGVPVNGFPAYGFDYHAGNPNVNMRPTYMKEFMEAFRGTGIKTGIYFNFQYQFNYASYDQVMFDFFEAAFHECMQKFPCDYVYFDVLGRTDRGITQSRKEQMYNAIKKYNNKVIIAGNLNPLGNTIEVNGDIGYWPIDAVGVEWYNHDQNVINQMTDNIHSFEGTDYYIPHKYSYSGIYRIDGGGNEQVQYPWLYNETGFYDGQQINQIRTQSEFQAEYDKAKQVNAPFWCNVPIQSDGTIDATYLSRMNNLVL